ncbi:N-acetylneuraminate synthase family protein [Capillimicrobium parvum]|uniref:N,N'-diacetyllegionaminic acid synthase n=1 Tax=Capillimicrobium parvum TaxID=2884022 RepID=A0A9E6Y2J3_9ACTN|nr:N-acetylneuraminate synthase family protein [Capillimicrobium parvum]UGS38718.1 N,N'-diacetyllegionaminic acid synthase [Capillimicrobium parvum]
MRIGACDTAVRPLVIAEIGNNHEGDPEVAAHILDAAADAGAGAVKLQTFDVRWFVRPSEPDRLARYGGFQLSADEVRGLAERARSRGLLFLSSPLDLGSVDVLEPLVDAYKVASGDNDFWPLLERIGATGKPVVLSAGLVDIEGVRRAKAALEAAGSGEVAVLHCVTAYPTPPASVNLAAMATLREAIGGTVGYSDHTLGVDACVAAAALGAEILEKHVTLRHDYSDFRDHQLSVDPGELAELVRRVDEVRTLVGEPGKAPQPEEEALRAAVRRSIVAAGEFEAGHVLGPGDLTWLRPRDGLAPGQEDLLLGRALRRAVAFGETIRVEDVE